jgi:hypothetical protein
MLYSTACIYTPGLTIESEKREVSFEMKKRILFGWGPRLNVKAQIKIRPYSFQAIKSCVAFRVIPSLIESSMGYESEVIGIEAPQMLGLRAGDVSVEVQISGDNFLGSIVKALAKDKIKDSIKTAIETQFEKRIDDLDLDKPEWVEKLVNSTYQEKLTNKLSHKLKIALQRQYIPDGKVLGSKMYDLCLATVSPLILPAPFKTTLLNDCLDFKQVSMEFFKTDSSSKKKGCYKYFTRLTELDPIIPSSSDLFKTCRFNHTLTIQVKPYLVPVASCLLNKWKDKSNLDCSFEIPNIRL